MVLKIWAEEETKKIAAMTPGRKPSSPAASSSATMEMLTQAVQELTKEVAKARDESSETRRKSRAVEKGNE